jgi:hypothetical protein
VPLYLIDSRRHLPLGGSELEELDHAEAVNLLRREDWMWHFEKIDSECYFRLEALARDAGVPMDGYNLLSRRLSDPRRMDVGGPHPVLLFIEDDAGEIIYRLAKPAAKS